MLQIKPDTDDTTEAEEKTDDALYCAACGHLVTRTRWAISMGGRERVFTNPTGYINDTTRSNTHRSCTNPFSSGRRTKSTTRRRATISCSITTSTTTTSTKYHH